MIVVNQGHSKEWRVACSLVLHPVLLGAWWEEFTGINNFKYFGIRNDYQDKSRLFCSEVGQWYKKSESEKEQKQGY